MTRAAMKISDQVLLEKCRDIELNCKEIYDFFAELFSNNDDAVRLWRKTAIEEQNHADQFTLALKIRKGLACQVTANSAKLDLILSQLLAAIKKIKAEPPELPDALFSAIKLEKYLADFHLTCVVDFEDGSYKRLFEAMMASDQEHIDSLQAFYDKLAGSQEWTFSG